MKKINKLFLSLILTALCLCSIIPFAACGEPQWQEVQSVTFNESGRARTITSTCEWEIITESITKSEYESAPDENKIEDKSISNLQEIDIDRQSFIAHAEEKVGSVFYGYDYWFTNSGENKAYFYYKYTLKSYKLDYVKVNILENDGLEINYYKDIIKISPSENGYLNDSDLPYKITYFEN